MEQTDGFYMFDGVDLNYAPNKVISHEFELDKELKNSYNYPVDGWYYFDSQEEAKTFFNIGEE